MSDVFLKILQKFMPLPALGKDTSVIAMCPLINKWLFFPSSELRVLKDC